MQIVANFPKVGSFRKEAHARTAAVCLRWAAAEPRRPPPDDGNECIQGIVLELMH